MSINEMMADTIGNEDLYSNAAVGELEVFSENDVTEAAVESRNFAWAISNLEAGNESLSATHAMLQADIKAGNSLTAQSAKYLIDGVSQIAAGSGLPFKANAAHVMPGCESFTESNKISLGLEVLATLSDKIKEYWAKLKAMVLRWYDAVEKFWVEKISSIGRMVNSAKALAEKAGKASDSTPKEKTLNVSPSQFTNLTTDNAFSVKDLEDGLKELGTVISKLRGDKSVGQELIAKITEELDGKKYDTTDNVNQAYLRMKVALFMTTGSNNTQVTASGDFIDKFIKGFYPPLTQMTTKHDAHKDDNVCVYRNATAFLGNKSIYAISTVNKDGVWTGTSVKLDYTVEKFQEKGMKKEAQKINALAGSEISSIATAVSGLAKIVVADKLDFGKRKKLLNDLTKTGDKIVAALDKIDKEDTDGTSSEAFTTIKLWVNGLSKHAKLIVEPGASLQEQAATSCAVAYNLALAHYINLKNK